ncbi:MAG TPA: bifunctional phosphopantothenoylcysteine decarboxylase/phosphopantothenate--cysteine ligase CoaBC [Thermodesulfovibrionales bacterium]|nr:bifunctional phosphopantothenoylcysteine decarboxylase/phosphopantothenate--cysteine ligase CoaBC [Thermodesulfovibrionales bacterium]
MSKSKKKVLKNKSVLLGVTGGVAAYKAIDLVRRLREENASVKVIMTEAAERFVTALSLETASGNPVYSNLFSSPMAHITLPSGADVMAIAPATANIIGKFANGIADDLLSTCLLALDCNVVLAPAMNWRMYENPVVKENLGRLLSRGVHQIGPEKGALACGEEGIGRLAEVPDIVDAIESALSKKDLLRERVLITAGPTREYIDPVRFLSNRSSGKMGYALAKAAYRRGADVTLISGPSHLLPPKGVSFIPVETGEDMLKAVNEHAVHSTMLIMSAAVCDFRPEAKAELKINKSNELNLKLIKSRDIIREAGKKKTRLFIIGFAAETGHNLERARRKMRDKKMDMIVFNDVTAEGAGFDVATNKVVIIDKEQDLSLPLMSKDAVADSVLDRAVKIKT